MDSKLDLVKEAVIKEAERPDFVHHHWFVKWHLHVVNRLAAELCLNYPDADRNVVKALVWLHDYGKILAGKPENFYLSNELTLVKGRELLESFGFSRTFCDKVIEYLDMIDRHALLDLSKAPIEVQIVSSADGASHLIGPFMFLYIYENAQQDFDTLAEGNVYKAKKNWEQKITLTEVKKRFQERYNYICEFQDWLPESIFGYGMREGAAAIPQARIANL